MTTKMLRIECEAHFCSCGQTQPLFVNDVECEKCGAKFDSSTECDSIKIEETFPARYEVCPCCNGRGSTYLGWHASEQPAYSAEDFDLEGHEFFEDYMSGRYDAQCPECKGRTTILELDCWDADGNVVGLTDWQATFLKRYEDDQAEEARYQAECAAERRMGA